MRDFDEHEDEQEIDPPPPGTPRTRDEEERVFRLRVVHRVTIIAFVLVAAFGSWRGTRWWEGLQRSGYFEDHVVRVRVIDPALGPDGLTAVIEWRGDGRLREVVLDPDLAWSSLSRRRVSRISYSGLALAIGDPKLANFWTFEPSWGATWKGSVAATGRYWIEACPLTWESPVDSGVTWAVVVHPGWGVRHGEGLLLWVEGPQEGRTVRIDHGGWSRRETEHATEFEITIEFGEGE